MPLEHDSVMGPGRAFLQSRPRLEQAILARCWFGRKATAADLPPPSALAALVGRVDPRFRSVFADIPQHNQWAILRYFFHLGSSAGALQPTRPKLIKWYDPFADQRTFPSGHRYCLNTYVGCEHGCVYCYVRLYARGVDRPSEANSATNVAWHAGADGLGKPRVKKDFLKHLAEDLRDLERFDVPPAPLHLSNSTDPLQAGLEEEFGHTRLALEWIAGLARNRFTSITLLTKNPGLAARPEYVAALKQLGEIGSGHPAHARLVAGNQPLVQVEVSLAFWSEEAAAFYDPHAPSVRKRIEGLQALRSAGIPTVLRIDPLFVRSPFGAGKARCLKEFGLPEAQTEEDLWHLVSLARDLGVRHVVFSPVKIVRPSKDPRDPRRALKAAFEVSASPARLLKKGFSWRLPDDQARALCVPSQEMCRRARVESKFCMKNLIERF
jgi:DNA repair photolyase